MIASDPYDLLSNFSTKPRIKIKEDDKEAKRLRKELDWIKE
jgi:hypothetical protein